MRTLQGVVEAFDADTGLGVVRAEDAEVYPFHCTELSDGTRSIPVGATVRFVASAGHLGRQEAKAVTPGPAAPL